MKQRKTLWKVTAFEQHIYNYPQHMTAQRVTARCSVIHTSSSLLSSLFSPLLSHTLYAKKKPKLIQTRKSLWPFSGIRGSFAGSWLFGPELGGRNKKRRLVIIFAPMVVVAAEGVVVVHVAPGVEAAAVHAVLTFIVVVLVVVIDEPARFGRGARACCCSGPESGDCRP